MNNPQMYDMSHAGGVPYPETDKYHYSRWFTTTGLTDGSEYKTIRFNVRQDNLLLHWTNSYLTLEGQLKKKTAGTAYTNAQLISLVHNAIPHMFSNVKLTVGSKLVENVNQIGHVSSMMYDVLYPRSKGKCDGLEFMWLPDTVNAVADNKGFAARRSYLMAQSTTVGKFKLRIPLHMFFGFMENFAVLKGYPVEIEMVRGPDYPALYRLGGTAAHNAEEGKLTFSSITLDIPIVEPSTVIALEYLKGVRDPQPFLYSFRQRHGMFAPVPANIQDFQQPITSSYFTERPQMIWVGFQTSNVVDQTHNHALYENAGVESMYIQMNNTQFPHVLMKADWAENNNGFFFEMQKHVRANYLQQSARYVEGSMLSPANFKDLYTIYCFDVSKQEMTLGSNNVTCELHVHFKTQSAEHLRVYIAWFNDRTLELFTDGSPINIRKEVANFDDG